MFRETIAKSHLILPEEIASALSPKSSMRLMKHYISAIAEKDGQPKAGSKSQHRVKKVTKTKRSKQLNSLLYYLLQLSQLMEQEVYPAL